MEVLYGLLGCAILLIVLVGIVMVAVRWNGSLNELRGQMEALRAELRRMEREINLLRELVGRSPTSVPSTHDVAPPAESSDTLAEQPSSTIQSLTLLEMKCWRPVLNLRMPQQIHKTYLNLNLNNHQLKKNAFLAKRR